MSGCRSFRTGPAPCTRNVVSGLLRDRNQGHYGAAKTIRVAFFHDHFNKVVRAKRLNPPSASACRSEILNTSSHPCSCKKSSWALFATPSARTLRRRLRALEGIVNAMSVASGSLCNACTYAQSIFTRSGGKRFNKLRRERTISLAHNQFEVVDPQSCPCHLTLDTRLYRSPPILIPWTDSHGARHRSPQRCRGV